MSKTDPKEIRTEYTKSALDEAEVSKNPFKQFEKWFQEAIISEVKEPNAMSLSTVDINSKPHSRIVLLKGFDESGFTFFTNQASRKGDEISSNPNVSLCFFWVELERQVRIEGVASKITKEESEDYFRTRPYKSQIGALASRQSEVVKNRDLLDKRFTQLSQQYAEKVVPMPKDWGGYKITPSYFEFWQGRRSRLHDRITFEKKGENWLIRRLSP